MGTKMALAWKISELVQDFLKAMVSKDDEILKFGGLKQQWEKNAAAIAWKISDIPCDIRLYLLHSIQYYKCTDKINVCSQCIPN